ncbi:MAG: InlB B-repeat-containing protein [Clostridiales Family XIII bacterium]|nr:InlB B-repeat-containing protein [Clostridiales Family XIII bacterium]
MMKISGQKRAIHASVLRVVGRFAICALLVVALAICPAIPGAPDGGPGSPFGADEAYAKTNEAPGAETLFVYAKNKEGKSVFLKAFSLSELKALQHGPGGMGDTVGTYQYSATDNFPDKVYTESKGFTIPELISKTAAESSASGAGAVSFSTASDRIGLMAADSGGNYTRTYTYGDLYGKQGYFYPGLLADMNGWTVDWEITGSGYNPQSQEPMPLGVYMQNHMASDATYQQKVAVSNGGIAMDAILAVDKVSDRMHVLKDGYSKSSSDILSGALSSELTDEEALTICIPQTPDALFSGNRTMYHYFKWVYNIRLDMAALPALASGGVVAAPEATVKLSESNPDEVEITLTTDTEGADIYYYCGTEGSLDCPMKPYPGVTVTASAIGASNSKPLKVYAVAVKEGWEDEGSRLVASYPAKAPTLARPSTSAPGQAVVITGSGVSADVWADWASKLATTSKLEHSSGGSVGVTPGGLTISNDPMRVTVGGDLITDSGEYKLTLDSNGYALTTVSFSVRKTPPPIAAVTAYYGERIDIPVSDPSYLSAVNGLSVRTKGESTEYNIGGSYFAKSPGMISINPAYYSAQGSRMKAAGQYIVTLSASGYSPEVEVPIDLKPPGDIPSGSFSYGLASDSPTMYAGGKVGVTASLTSGSGAFTFYAGEYRITLPAGFSASNIKTKNGWEYGTSQSGGRTVITFARLEGSLTGAQCAAYSAIATFDVTAGASVAPGQSASIDCTNALLTDEVAFLRSHVSGKGLALSVIATPVPIPDPGIYTPPPAPAPAFVSPAPAPASAAAPSASGSTKSASKPSAKKVTLNTAGGTKIIAKIGDKLSSVKIPKKKGYKFKGWYTKRKGGVKLKGSYVIKKNSKIYAHWKKK